MLLSKLVLTNLGYYNLQLKFSSQVNFNIKEDLSFILNEKSSFSVETVQI